MIFYQDVVDCSFPPWNWTRTRSEQRQSHKREEKDSEWCRKRFSPSAPCEVIHSASFRIGLCKYPNSASKWEHEALCAFAKLIDTTQVARDGTAPRSRWSSQAWPCAVLSAGSSDQLPCAQFCTAMIHVCISNVNVKNGGFFPLKNGKKIGSFFLWKTV